MECMCGAPRSLASVEGQGMRHPTCCTRWSPHGLDEGHTWGLPLPISAPQGLGRSVLVWAAPFTSKPIAMQLT